MRQELKLSKVVGGGYSDFWHFTGRYRIVKGSRASKKSKTCALYFIWALFKYPLSNVLVVRRYQTTLRDSCFSDLKWAVNRLGLAADFRFTTSPLEIVRISTGQKIIFRGLDDAQKITSISVSTGVLNFVWIEEASQLTNETEFNKLDLSIRGEVPEGYFKQLTLSFNPWSDQHFLKRRFFDVKSKDILAITTNYLCNEWLDESDRRIFEEMKARSPRRYLTEGLGEWGRAEGLIFTNFIMRDFDFRMALQLPRAVGCWGVDFGFTDPTAITGAVLCPEDKAIFVFAEDLIHGASIEQIAKSLRRLGVQHERVFCDAAEPRSIAELKRFQINAQPSIKGPDSVRFGIQTLQSFQIIIHPSCTEFYKSIQNYAWEMDRQGNPTDKPEHEYSHMLDALRYSCLPYIEKKPLKFNAENLKTL